LEDEMYLQVKNHWLKRLRQVVGGTVLVVLSKCKLVSLE